MHTIRPVKRFDSINSNRASAEHIRHTDSRRSSSGSMLDTSAPPSPSLSTEAGVIGRAMVEEVINPVLEQNLNAHENDLSPEDVETISLISNGFSDLAESNPELTYQIILDLLNGINEHDLIRKHIMGSSNGLLARNTVKHRSGTGASRKNVAAELEAAMNEEDSGSEADSAASRNDLAAQQRGPVAEMLYSRWLEVGLLCMLAWNQRAPKLTTPFLLAGSEASNWLVLTREITPSCNRTITLGMTDYPAL